MLRHAASGLLRRSPLASARSARQLSSVIVAGDQAGYKKAIDSDDLVVVYFTASWCGPCKIISPIFDQLSQDHPTGTFVKVDVDELPDVAAENRVSAMPTFLVIKERRLYDTIVGANEAKLRGAVEKHTSY